jgi:hypothetical protein
MKKGLFRPKWWLLYLMVAFIVGLFWLESTAPLSTVSRTWAGVGLILVLYWLVMSWIKVNETALLSEDWEKYKKNTFKAIHDTPPSKGSSMPIRNAINGPGVKDQILNGRILPARLISLAAVILAFFKTQDQ